MSYLIAIVVGTASGLVIRFAIDAIDGIRFEKKVQKIFKDGGK